MAEKFVLTAQVNFQANNANLGAVVSQINKSLRSSDVNIRVNVPTSANAQIKKLNKDIGDIKTSAEASTEELKKFGQAAAVSLRRFFGFTLVASTFFKLTQALRSGIDEAIEFNRELVKIGQVTGSSTRDLKDLSDEVTRLATNLGVSSSKLLNVSQILAQAGLSANDTRIALEALAKTELSPTFENLENTTEGVVAIMSQFKTEAEDLEGQLGSLNAVSARFAVESSDLVTAIRRTGGAFKASGGSLNELLALFTSVRATTRESAESIATGFRTIFTRLQRPRTINFLESLGIDLIDEGRFVGPIKAIEELNAALAKIDDRDPRFAQIIEELGGFRQVSKVIPLIKEFTTTQEALIVAQQGSNTLAIDAERAQEALGIRITKVKEEFSALLREFADTSTFRTFVDLTIKLADSFIQLARSLEPILPLLLTVGAIGVGRASKSILSGFGGNIGSLLGFARGGLVPGSGNGDTVPAMLTPGEFVIRKKAVQALGPQKLNELNKFAAGGEARFEDSPVVYIPPGQIGGAFLFPKNVNDDVNVFSAIGRSRSNANVTTVAGYSRHYVGQEARTVFDEVSRSTLSNAVTSLASVLGGGDPGKSGDLSQDQLASILENKADLKAIQGQLFEGALSAFAGVTGRAGSRTSTFDFSPSEVPLLSVLFGNNLPSFIDAKRSEDQDSITSLINKALTQQQVSKFTTTLGDPSLPEKAKKAAIDSLVRQRGAANRASGGPAPSDTVPAMLTPGEFVVNKDAAKKIGLATLYRLNQADKIKGFAKGGAVGHFQTGGAVFGGLSGNNLLGLTAAFSILPALLTQFTGLNSEVGKTTKVISEVASQFTILKFASEQAASIFGTSFRDNQLLFEESIKNTSAELDSLAALQKDAVVAFKEVAENRRQTRRVDRNEQLFLSNQILSAQGRRQEVRQTAGATLARQAAEGQRLQFLEARIAQRTQLFGVPVRTSDEARRQRDVAQRRLNELDLFEDVQRKTGQIPPGGAIRERERLNKIINAAFSVEGDIDEATKLRQTRPTQRETFLLSKEVKTADLELKRLQESAKQLDDASKQRENAFNKEIDLAKQEFKNRQAIISGKQLEQSIQEKELRQLEARERAFQRLTIVGALASAALTSLGSALETSARKALEAGDVSRTSDFRTGATLRGAGSGAGTGLALGAAVGSVIPGIGTAIGAGIGGITGALIGGATEFNASAKTAERIIRGVEFDKFFTKFQRDLQNVQQGLTTPEQQLGRFNSGVGRLRTELLTATDADAVQTIRGQIGNSVVGIQSFLISLAKTSNNFAEFNSRAGEAVAALADFTDQPLDEVNQSFLKVIESNNNLVRINSLLSAAQLREFQRLREFNAFSGALQDTILTLDNFNVAFETVAGLTSGRTTDQVRDRSAIFNRPEQILNRLQFANITRQTGAQFGPRGGRLAEEAIQAQGVLSNLSEILLETVRSAPLAEEGGFEQRLGEQLRDVPAFIREAILANTASFIGNEAKDEKIIDAVRTNVGSVVAELGGGILENIFNFFEQNTALLATQTNQLSALYDQRRAIEAELVNDLNRQVDLREEQATFNFERRDRTLPLGAALNFDRQRQQNILGPANVGLINNPAAIAARLQDAQNKILEKNIQLQSADFETRTRLLEEINSEREAVDSLTGALKFLSDASSRNAALQRELSVVRNRREAISGVGREFARGGIAERRELGRGALGARLLGAGLSPERLTEEIRSSAFEFLDRFREAGPLAFLGDRRAEDVERDATRRSLVDTGVLTPEEAARFDLPSSDEERLATAINDNFNRAIIAQNEIIASKSDAQITLLTNIRDNTAAFSEIFEKNLARGELQTATAARATVATSLDENRRTFDNVNIVRGGLAGLGLTGDTSSLIRNLIANRDSIGQISGRTSELQNLNQLLSGTSDFRTAFTRRAQERGSTQGSIDTRLLSLFPNTPLGRGRIAEDEQITSNLFRSIGLSQFSNIGQGGVTTQEFAELRRGGRGNTQLNNILSQTEENLAGKFANGVANVSDFTDALAKAIEATSVNINTSRSELVSELDSLTNSLGLTLGQLGELARNTDFIGALNRLPKDVNFNQLSVDTSRLNNEFNILTQQINNLNARIGGRPPVGRNNGGIIPGFGNTDSVPAMLTPGEFVIRKEAVNRLGINTLQQLNSGRVKFAEGGLVSSKFTSKQQEFINRNNRLVTSPYGRVQLISSDNQTGASSQTISMSSEAINAMNNFSSNVNTLSSALNNFPRDISMSVSHRVEVIHNGAQVFAGMQESIVKLIEAETTKALNNMINQKFPDVGRV